MLLTDVDILALIGSGTALKRVAGTNSGEYAGACPFCGGVDRFRVWARSDRGDGRGRFWCRQCGRKGDVAQYVMERDGVPYPVACERLGLAGRGAKGATARARQTSAGRAVRDVPVVGAAKVAAAPCPAWQARGEAFCEECERALWEQEGETALAYLRQRGFTDDTLRAARLGFNGQDRFDEPGAWGLTGKRVWLPKGVVIPYRNGGALWGVQIRRPVVGQDKYRWVRGGGNALWNADSVDGTKPIVLCEGVFNALAAQQCAGDLCVSVAAGSTTGARLSQWIARLALAPAVLVAFDNDANEAGDKAALYWLGVLPGARRWRPYWGDANDMAKDGADVRAWIEAGLRRAGALPIPEETREPATSDEFRAFRVEVIEAEAAAETVAESAVVSGRFVAAADYPDPDAYLVARFREYADMADAAGVVDAMDALKRRDRRLWQYLNDCLNDREAHLSQEWQAFQEGKKAKGAVIYAMERWAEALLTFADCKG